MTDLDLTKGRADGYKELIDTKEIAISLKEKRNSEHQILVTQQKLEKLLKGSWIATHALHFRIAILGSARLVESSPEFIFVRDLTQALVNSREMDIVTGGGPGLMEAGHQGLSLATKNGRSRNIGLQIDGGREKTEGDTTLLHFQTKHAMFSTRLQQFADLCHGAYCAPGGYGTALEMLYFLQLRQFKHLESSFPLLAHPIWEQTVEILNNTLYHKRKESDQSPLINEEDLNLLRFSDKIEEIVAIFSQCYDDWFTNIKSHVKIVK